MFNLREPPLERQEVKLLKEILEEIRKIHKLLFPSNLTIVFKGATMSSSAVTLLLQPTPQSVQASVQEVFQGKPYTPNPTDLTWSVQDPSIVSLVTNPDGTAVFTALAVGVTQVGCSDTTTKLSGVGTVTVVLTADGLSIVFGQPV